MATHYVIKRLILNYTNTSTSGINWETGCFTWKLFNFKRENDSVENIKEKNKAVTVAVRQMQILVADSYLSL